MTITLSNGSVVTPSTVTLNSALNLTQIYIPNWCTNSSSAGYCNADSLFNLTISGGTNPLQLIGNTSPTSTMIYSTTSAGYLVEGYYSGLKPATILVGAGIIINSVTIGSGLVLG